MAMDAARWPWVHAQGEYWGHSGRGRCTLALGACSGGSTGGHSGRGLALERARELRRQDLSSAVDILIVRARHTSPVCWFRALF